MDDLRRQLKDLDLEKDLKRAHKRVADSVVQEARPRMAGLPVGGAANTAATMRAALSGIGARISFGGKNPWDMGVEFGAHRNVPRNVTGGRQMLGWNQFQDWRGAGGDSGYALFPTIRDQRERIMATYLDEIDRLLRPAFPD